MSSRPVLPRCQPRAALEDQQQLLGSVVSSTGVNSVRHLTSLLRALAASLATAIHLQDTISGGHSWVLHQLLLNVCLASHLYPLYPHTVTLGNTAEHIFEDGFLIID